MSHKLKNAYTWISLIHHKLCLDLWTVYFSNLLSIYSNDNLLWVTLMLENKTLNEKIKVFLKIWLPHIIKLVI